jgi:hypothetical protein
MKLNAFAFALLAMPLIAIAQSNDTYECQMGNLSRRVVVERAGSAPVPCEVVYLKDSEAPGEREVLWSAQNDGGYCSARATEFVARLEGLGWQCSMAGAEREIARDEN